MCLVAVPIKDQRSLLMGIEKVGREVHPRILRFGSRLIAGINPDCHHRRSRLWRIHAPPATRIGLSPRWTFTSDGLAVGIVGRMQPRGWARIERKGCITVLRPSRRALRAFVRMRVYL